MATMIPENVEEFKTEGEKKFYKFLEVVAKPDSRHITWYTPNIEGKEPDFILFSQNVGLIIFEVKDWVSGHPRFQPRGPYTVSRPHYLRPVPLRFRLSKHRHHKLQVRDS